MDDNIIYFINNQSVITICCVDEDATPYCFPCFFAFNSIKQLLYFKSSPTSYHALLLSKKPGIAGSILPDKLNVLALKGIQLEGVVLPPGHELAKDSSEYYYRKYPMALLIPGKIYTIELTGIKMTAGVKSIGKKITWQREESAELQF